MISCSACFCACSDSSDDDSEACTADVCKDGTTLIVCDKASGTTTEKKCDSGCKDNACSDATKCTADVCKDDTTLRVCEKTAGTTTEKKCDNGCKDNACVSASKCTADVCKDDTTLLVCDKTAGTTTEKNCENGCKDNACVSASKCTADVCKDDTTLLVCDKEAGTTTEKNCENGCKDNACLTYSVGDLITFGHYEQDNDPNTTDEAITWRILDKNESGQYLIISEKALDVRPYNTAWITITWEKSTIRSWLNGYDADYNTSNKSYTSDNFIDTAFTTAEKAKIVSSNVPADANPDYITPPGNATTDHIFLLSIAEAEKYFSSAADRQAEATRYVVIKGAYVYGSESEAYTSNSTCTDVQCLSSWWLRSPGNDDGNAASVGCGGNLYNSGNIVNASSVTVRPALWVNL